MQDVKNTDEAEYSPVIEPKVERMNFEDQENISLLDADQEPAGTAAFASPGT